MKLKPGVDIEGIQPETLVGMIAAYDVCRKLNVPCVITSVLDGKHSKKSLHYTGFAFDLRSRDMDAPRIATEMLKMALPNDFDIVREKTHIHVEFQPKPRSGG